MNVRHGPCPAHLLRAQMCGQRGAMCCAGGGDEWRFVQALLEDRERTSSFEWRVKNGHLEKEMPEMSLERSIMG